MGPQRRFGLIGAGRWGKVYIRTLLSLPERCRLTHLATSRPENGALIPHPVTVVSDWRELVRMDCDAVIIATPPSTHAEILEACVTAGKPCIVEKPLCLDQERAQRIHESVERSGIPVLVNHVHLFNPAYLALKHALQAAASPIRVIVSEGMSLGPFRPDTSALWDWCPHDLSLCLDLLATVPCTVDALAGPGEPDGVPEMVALRLGFPRGEQAWVHAGRLSAEKRRTLSVFTDERLFVWDDLAREPVTVQTIRFGPRYLDRSIETQQPRVAVPVMGQKPMEEMIRYFLEGLSGGDRTRFGTNFALDVVTVLAGCEEALQRSAAAARGMTLQ